MIESEIEAPQEAVTAGMHILRLRMLERIWADIIYRIDHHSMDDGPGQIFTAPERTSA